MIEFICIFFSPSRKMERRQLNLHDQRSSSTVFPNHYSPIILQSAYFELPSVSIRKHILHQLNYRTPKFSTRLITAHFTASYSYSRTCYIPLWTHIRVCLCVCEWVFTCFMYFILTKWKSRGKLNVQIHLIILFHTLN
jgi:hypothetical protein